jgi:hypothetical protein
VYLAVHAEFPHPARDQLRVLRAKVDDQDAIGMNIRGARARIGNPLRTRDN